MGKYAAYIIKTLNATSSTESNKGIIKKKKKKKKKKHSKDVILIQHWERYGILEIIFCTGNSSWQYYFEYTVFN